MAGASAVCRICRPRPRPLWSSHIRPRCRLEAHVGSQTGSPGHRSASSRAAAPPDRSRSSAASIAKAGARGTSPAALRARRAVARETRRGPRGSEVVLRRLRSEEVPLEEFKLSHIEPSTTPVTINDGYMFLCSYNKIVDPEKGFTVVSPGDAPVWSPPSKCPVKLRLIRKHATKQYGYGLRQNDATFMRMQTFTAMEAMRPDFLFDDVDVIIEARVLRKIFSYCFGEDIEGIEQQTGSPTVRLDLFLAGEKTLFVEHHRSGAGFFRTVSKPLPKSEKPSTHEDYMKLRSVVGTAFEQTYTRKQSLVARLGSHQRFLLYRIGDLKVLVEVGVDARFQSPLSISPEELGERDHWHYQISTADPGSWIPHQTFPYVANIELSGRAFPQAQTLELKIGGREKLNEDTAKLHPDYLSQCWFSRVSHIAYGVVPRGGLTLEDVKMIRMDEACREWEQLDRTQLALRRLPVLLAYWRYLVRRASQSATHAHHRAAFAILDGKDFGDATVRVVLPSNQPSSHFSPRFLERWWESQRPGGSEFLRMQQARLECGDFDTGESADRLRLRSSHLAASSTRRGDAAGAAPDLEPEVSIESLSHTEEGHRPGEGWAARYLQSRLAAAGGVSRAAVEEEVAWQKMHIRAAAEFVKDVPKKDAHPPRKVIPKQVADPQFKRIIPKEDAQPPFTAKSWDTVQSPDDVPPGHGPPQRQRKRVGTEKESSGKPTIMGTKVDSTKLKDTTSSSGQPTDIAMVKPIPQDLGKQKGEPPEPAKEIPSRFQVPKSEGPRQPATTMRDRDEQEARAEKIAKLLQASTVRTIKSTKAVEAKIPGSVAPKVEKTAIKNVEEKVEEQVEKKIEARVEQEGDNKAKKQTKKQALALVEEKGEDKAEEKVELQTKEKVKAGVGAKSSGVEEKGKIKTEEKVKVQTRVKAEVRVKEKGEISAQEMAEARERVEVRFNENGEIEIRVRGEGETKTQEKVEAKTGVKTEVRIKEKRETKAEFKVEKQAQEKPLAKKQAKPTTRAAVAPVSFVPGEKPKPKPARNPEPAPDKSKSKSDVPPKSSTGTYFMPSGIDWP
ncbi:hypothetical protein MAPG_04205 [Magnaporthiopsis poae ATCC 64411]|uniref:Uncharacterized protein n=1 Tax=Magnaporthiopsis poae (strain ATCC 64411 / 73-15) TaxID=644358 RepID=A0A0C4DW34_MAGP6|nr:hypothetical protein MAPG_04205 [Magnaporthiopsis poae ATCC 64411]